MKIAIVVLACVLAAANAQFNRANAFAGFGFPQNQYRKQQAFRPFSTVAPQVYRPFSTAAPLPLRPVPVAPVAPVVAKSVYDARDASIVRSDNEINPDGSYSYYYETSNGIAAQEQGSPRNFGGNPPVVPDVAQGSFSWTSPEGQVVSISYVADENGYQPVGSAIPTPPPVPPQIARALEYIARNAPRK